METNKEMKLPVYNLDYDLVRTYGKQILAKEKEKRNPQKLKINYVTITPDNKYVVCGYKSGQIAIFDKETTEAIKYFKAHSGKVQHIEFYQPDNVMLTCGADGKVLIFDLTNFTFIQEIVQPPIDGHGHLKEIRFALISEGMKHIYFGSQNGCLYKCDKSNNYKPYVFVNPEDMYPSEPYFLTSGVFSPDKRYLVFTSGYSIKFVNLETGKVEKKFGDTKHYINDVTFYPNNENIVATWSQDGTITYWDIQSERELISFSASDDDDGYSHLVFNNSGTYLASANDGHYVNIWDAVTKHPIAKIKDKVSMDGMIKAHKKTVKSMIFVDDDELLTCSFDGTAKYWKLKQLNYED